MDSSSIRILLVDDDHSVLLAMSDYLEDHEYQVLLANNGKEGFDVFQRESPDLVLTDLRMPEIGGLDLIKEIRNVSSEIPIIVASGTGNIEDSIEALKNGAYDYILKPIIDMAVILHAIEQALEYAQLMRENREYRENLENLVEKRTEQLKCSEANLRNFFDTNSDFLWVFDESGEIVAVNNTVMQRLGYTENEIIGQSAGSMHSLEQRKAVEGFVANILAGRCEVCSSSLVTKEGCQILVETSGVQGTWDNDPAVFGISKDVTALKQSEEKFSKAFHSSPVIMFLADLKDSKIIEVNDTFCETFGFSRHEAVGENLIDLLKVDVCYNENVMTKLIESGSVRQIETVACSKTGSSIDLLLSAEIIEIQDRKYNFTTSINITDRKRAKEEMRRMQRLDSLGTIAGGIAHDFNNILMGVYGNIELAEMELDEDHEAKSFLTQAHHSIDRAKHLTGRLLTFAKGGNPMLKKVNLARLVQDATAFNMSGSNISIVYDFADDLKRVRVDSGQIDQVVSNLVINAKQAMPAGGCLYIGAQNVKGEECSEVEGLAGEYAKLTIRDEGTGIPKDILERVFDPYFTTKQAGSGLGLAVSHSIITKHKGRMTVVSTPGEGTEFTVFLPVIEASEPNEIEQAVFEGAVSEGELPTASPTASLTVSNETVMRILLMDDDELICVVGAKMLKSLGYEVVTTSDGQMALKQYALAKEDGLEFDAVIADMTVPGGMGGREMLDKMKLIDEDVVVIVTSGYSDDSVMENYSQYGFSGKLSKPFRILDLKDAILKAVK